MNLPSSQNLPISQLTGVFTSTSATYKFYWFLAIIEAVENGKQQISKRELFARMISNSWYTVNYFKVSFGKQDLIQSAVRDIKDIEGLPIDIKRNELQAILEQTSNSQTTQILNHFNKNVPHWFLTPWLQRTPGVTDTEYKREIYASSQIYQNDCAYALYDDHIIINP